MEISIKWNICRICLHEERVDNPNMKSIFNESRLAKQIVDCAGIELSSNDGLPEKICRKCLLSLKYAVSFRNTCRKSDEHLRSVIQKAKQAANLDPVESTLAVEEIEDLIEELDDGGDEYVYIIDVEDNKEKQATIITERDEAEAEAEDEYEAEEGTVNKSTGSAKIKTESQVIKKEKYNLIDLTRGDEAATRQNNSYSVEIMPADPLTSIAVEEDDEEKIMTSIIKLHAISGAMDESPPCYILQIDEVRILLDCGWDEKFDTNFIKELKRHVHSIDAVLLSHPDVYHLGALPYLVGKLGLNCPIYATIPVYKMGQMFMYDLYMSHYNMYDFDLFTLDDVDTAFDKITQLKYNQTLPLKGKGYGIAITPLPAGHMIGGTIWKIVKVGEEDIVYATDFNHKKERHLNGCELERLQRPSLLITDAYNAQYQQARRRARDEKLMTNILQTVRNNGNVLIAIDTSGRVLEVAHMLDQVWRNKESGLMAYTLALLNNVSYNVIEFAKSQIEWMSDKLMKNFEGARNNPFQFKHIQICHNLSELAKLPAPKVVLASTPDMESGYSRELFVQWAENPNNSIIFTTRTAQGTLAMDLVENSSTARTIELDVRRRVELEGAELEEYLRTQGEKLNRLIVKQDVDEESSSDSDDDIEMSVITGKHDIVIRPGGRQHTGFFKSSKRHHVMFPFQEEKIKSDEYGEIINLDDYRIAEVGMDTVMTDENNKENIKKEEERIQNKTNDEQLLEKPTKCVSQRKTIEVNAQIQRIDFEGRSDGESMMKILSQLRPRRVIVVHGTQESTEAVARHCAQNIGARVFSPQKGETIDVTTETHIYQVRLTEGLVAQLQFQKGKDAEVAWIDARIGMRTQAIDMNNANNNNNEVQYEEAGEEKTFTLEMLDADEIPKHNSVLINELKLSDFKQVLLKNNINSEFSGGVLWCNNGTLALRRVDAGKVTIEGCLSEEYYRIRELLYEQYAIV